jgi:hypothetical protein
MGKEGLLVFSLAVRDAYRGACAVTGEHCIPVLEAAHIVPYARDGQHRVDNGLLLRRGRLSREGPVQPAMKPRRSALMTSA